MRRLIARLNSGFSALKVVVTGIGVGLLSLMTFDLTFDYLAGAVIAGSYLVNMGLFPWRSIQKLRPSYEHRLGVWITCSLVLGLFVAFVMGVYIKMTYSAGIPLSMKISFWGVIQALCFLDGVKDAWAAAIENKPKPSHSQ